MKTKTGLFIICFLMLATQQGKAQTKDKKVLQEMAAKKQEREKQIGQLRTIANEQKGQQQFEKNPNMPGGEPPAKGQGTLPAAQPGITEPAAVLGRTDRRN